MTYFTKQPAARLWTASVGLALLLPAIVLLAHAGLWRQAEWRDEYGLFHALNAYGWAGEWTRLRHWSPRPVSELLVVIYWWAVRGASGPMLVASLASAWFFPALGLLAGFRPWAGAGRPARAAVCLAIPTLCLLAGPVSELYYWPVGSLAYLPALAASYFAVARIAGPGLKQNTDILWVAVALTLGAASVEVGAFLAILATPALVLAARGATAQRPWRRVSMAILPALAGAMVMVALVHGRVARGMEMFGATPQYHHVLPSLSHAASEFAEEFLHLDGLNTAYSILARLLMVAGAGLCLRQAWPARAPWQPVLALMAALAMTAFVSIAAAYYNFGILCCERHAAYRQALFVLMAVTAGALWRPQAKSGWGPIALAAAVAISMPPRLPALQAEYHLAHARAAAWKAIFRSGRQAGPAPIDFVIAPDGPLFTYGVIPPGHYDIAQNPGWVAASVLQFFNKAQMDARPAPK